MDSLLKVSNLFEIKYGVNLELIRMEVCNNKEQEAIPFVARTEKNNGIVAFVRRISYQNTNMGHTLSLAASGSVMSVFYQPKPYYSGRDLYVLIPKKEMSVIEMLFYATCISKNKFRYNYGRQANKTLKDILIPKRMPVSLKQKMSSFLKRELNRDTKPISTNQIKIKSIKWKSFKICDLFEIEGTKTTSISELEEYGIGKYPYVTTQATNNGTKEFYDYYTEESNVLTVDSAVLGYCSYQPFNFSASDHVEKMIPKFEMNKYIALFLVKIMNLEQYRYNYGRKCSQSRIKKISVKLPNNSNKPDFQYMENFIKSLAYSSSI